MFFFFFHEILKIGWLFHCNTGTFWKFKLPLPCFELQLDNYEACSRNITDETTPGYSEKINVEVPVGLSFQALLWFLGKEKSVKITTLKQ